MTKHSLLLWEADRCQDRPINMQQEEKMAVDTRVPVRFKSVPFKMVHERIPHCDQSIGLWRFRK